MCPISSIQDYLKTVNPQALERLRYLIVILLNPNNLTNAGNIIIENFSYLNLRTRDVHFFIPGLSEVNYSLANEQEEYAKRIVAEMNKQSGVSFDSEGFVKSLSWFEESLNGYIYSEGTNLIIVDTDALKSYVSNPFKRLGLNMTTHVDRNQYVSFDLDQIHRDGLNVVRFLSEITTRLERGLSSLHELRYFAELPIEGYDREVNIFIAGSKYLDIQRNYVKSELLRIQNRLRQILRIYTFEDFDDSFIEGGRQEQYNNYIRNRANHVIFVLDGKVGGITLDEFKIAMKAFQSTGHPKIFVYSKIYDNQDCIQEEDDSLVHIELIKAYCSSHNQYYTEYRHDSELPLYVYRSFSELLR